MRWPIKQDKFALTAEYLINSKECRLQWLYLIGLTATRSYFIFWCSAVSSGKAMALFKKYKYFMSYHSRRDGSVALWLPKFCIQIKMAIKRLKRNDYGDEKTRLNSTAYLQTIRRKNIMQLPPICTRTQGPIRLEPWCRIRKIINLASLWHITSLHCNRFWLRLNPSMSGENKKRFRLQCKRIDF